MFFNINELILALGMSLDLAGRVSYINELESSSHVNIEYKNLFNHSLKCGYISMELCNELNLNSKDKRDVYIAAILHDIGIAANNNYYVEESNSNFIPDHCISGSKTIATFPNSSNLKKFILYHHENINGTGTFKLSGNDIPLGAQIIRMSDLIDNIYADKDPIKGRDLVKKWVSKNSNVIFSEKLSNSFSRISLKESFWYNLYNLTSYNFILDSYVPNFDNTISLDDLLSISYSFSSLIDAHSSFTATHSKEIGDLTYKISKSLGFSEEKSIKMKIAGLLHDIEKLAIPRHILHKNGKLTNDEFLIIKSHSYYTWLILSKVKDLSDICEWASNHHEKLNGLGYPNNLMADKLSFESRIVAVCDIYQALKEDRPYKKGFSEEKTFEILDDLIDKNEICKDAVQCLKNVL